MNIPVRPNSNDSQLEVPTQVRWQFRSWISAGLICASTATICGFELLPIELTASSLNAAPKSPQKEVAELTPGDGKVKLNFFSASWPRVFQEIAESGDMEFIGDTMPRGRFSRVDKTEYTRADAIRIVNREIEPQGLRLIEKGKFLILIDIATTRAEFPRAVLPKKNSEKPSDSPAASKPETNQATVDSSGRKNERVSNAVYQEESSGQSRSGQLDRKSSAAERMSSVKQTSLDETEANEVRPQRRNPEFGQSINPDPQEGATGSPFITYRPKNQPAMELSKRVYRALRSEAETIDSGRNGFPAFRVISAQFKSEGSNQKNSSARPVEFMVSIDEVRNELLIEGTPKGIEAVTKLLKTIDRSDADQTRTQIKPSTRYVCQIADQLPAEIDRLRAAAGSKAVARNVTNAKVPWLADEAQRKVPAGRDQDEKKNGVPLPEQGREQGKALGNFKGEINIEVIDDLNVMIIRGNDQDVEQIMDVIKQIEKLSEATAPEVHLIHLKNVEAESLSELLTSVYEKLIKFPGRATQPRESVAIIPVAKPNSLLIVAPGADVESILDLANQLDQPVDPQTEFQVFPLKSAIAADVETLISEFYKERKSLDTKVLVIADPRSNSVIVRARPRDLDEIKELIQKMDRDEVGAVSQVKIFILKNAVATDMAAVINAAIQSVISAPRSTSSGGGQAGANTGLGGGQVDEQFRGAKSTVLQFLTVDKSGLSRQFRSGILSDIRITPDAHANSLIVTASEQSMDLITALIQSLDRPTNTVSVIKVFSLENADANQIMQQLNLLFNNQAQGGNNALRQQLGLALANADDASSSLVPLKFSVDARTNSIIAVGSADAMRVVEAILLRLDESNLRARKIEVVRLNNAPALQIATAITQFFQQQRDLTQNDPNLVSNVEQLEREVIVIPDTVSNNLLVSSTPRYMPEVKAMIQKLDSEPRQVVIQALIVEVQLNNTDEFGIELGVQSPVLFQRSLLQPPVTITSTTYTSVGNPSQTNQVVLSQEGVPGFNFNNPALPLGNNVSSSPGYVGGQALSNYSLGRANSDLGYGGLVLSAGSQSVNALLRALAANRKIQILSRPQIRALDSQPAEVFVGRTIPTVQSFQTNATTGVISPILQQRETGIGMQVTPRINQEGNIVINLYAYRSQLSKDTVNVTTDSRGQPVGQPITDLSNVRSTVLVPSNSTIVIGGMISSRDETFTRKAPLLGDIPVLGHLFRYDSRSSIRSELLIFLTPRIVNGLCEEETLKEIEMGRLHFIESEAEEAHGPLRAVPAPDEVFSDEPTEWLPTTVQPPVGSPTPVIPQNHNTRSDSGPGMLPEGTSQQIPPSPTSSITDKEIQQISDRRAKLTEEDLTDSPVTNANWSSKTPAQPASPRRWGLLNRSRKPAEKKPVESTNRFD